MGIGEAAAHVTRPATLVSLHVPGHPRAGTSPYVFEHILVAEQLLGRYLVEGEPRPSHQRRP